MTEELRMSFLGESQFFLGDTPVGDSLPLKARALLCYLVLTGRPHSRPALAGLLWGERPERRALMSLRQAMAALRRLFAPYLLGDRQTIAFDQARPHWVDVEEFERLASSAQEEAVRYEGQKSSPSPLPPARLAALQQAVGLYRGDFLAGFHVRGAPAFEEWAAVRRERLRAQVMLALHALAAHYVSLGEYRQALRYARRLLELEPWLEEVHRQVMWLLAHTGQFSAALAQYETCRRTLAEELGVDVATPTAALYERIKAARSARHDNLPLQPTPFVGREPELATLRRLLADPAIRLLTLIGPGGVGKTRLALQVAAHNRDHFLHGVCFVPLDTTTTAAHLPATIASALGFPFHGPEEPATQLTNYLRDKELLLVLDGFEHLPDGVPLLSRILDEAPAVKLLVTSQAHLRLRWERLFAVEGMRWPPDEAPFAPESYDALALFLQVARRVRPRFSPEGVEQEIAAVCRAVEGLPLGIELAAAWVGEIPCATIAAELEHNLSALASPLADMPVRHRSLRAAFEHSWRLLAPEERRALGRLSVFRGGFAAEAAWEVAAVSAATLAALEQRSLLRTVEPGRYALLDVLRKLAAEKLGALPDEKRRLRERHGVYYAAFLRRLQAASDSLEKDEGAYLDEIGREIENLRRGWAWAVEQGRTAEIESAIEPLYRFHEARGLFREGETLFEEAVSQLVKRGVPRDAAVVGRLLTREGTLAYYLGRYEKARRLLEEGLTLARRHGEQWEAAFALNTLGILSNMDGEYREGKRLFLESLALYETVGDRKRMTTTLNNLGIVERLRGNYAAAERYSLESLSLARTVAARRAEARALQNLGLIAHCRQDYEAAGQFHRESLAIFREERDWWGVALALSNLGEAVYRQGEYAAAQRYYERSLELRRRIGDRLGVAIALGNLGDVAIARQEAEEARRCFEQALEIAFQIPSHPLAREMLVGFCRVLEAEGQPKRALKVLAWIISDPASEAWLRSRAQEAFDELATDLPPDMITTVREEGKRMSITDAVALVRSAS